MKRLFILASAAALMLASCAKTTVVYNEAPEEIGFKAVTGVMTKAPIPTGNLPTNEGNMIVYALKSADNSVYAPAFGPVEFQYKDSYWGGVSPQYWPESGYMKFMAYYPASIGDAEGTVDVGLTVENIDIEISQTDILYTVLTSESECAAKTTVPMSFKHALSLIEVKAKVADANMSDVVISSVEIVTPNMKGTVQFNKNSVPTWSSQTPMATNYPMNRTLSTALTASYQSYGIGTLVVPGDQADLKITYSVAGMNAVSITKDLTGTWDPCKKYIYNLIVSLDEIKLSATVADWDGTDDEDVEVDKNAI